MDTVHEYCVATIYRTFTFSTVSLEEQECDKCTFFPLSLVFCPSFLIFNIGPLSDVRISFRMEKAISTIVNNAVEI